MRRMKYKYYVDVAYLNTEKDEIQLDYLETLAYSATEASKDVVEYLEKFPNITHTIITAVARA